MVGSTSRSTRVVTGEKMQIVTVFPSAAETTLSSSPTTAPGVSTSSSNVIGGDVHRVIRRDPAPSPNRVLAGSGVGRGAVRRPTKQSTGRGQGLTGMLADSARRAGRGQSTPSPGQDKGKDGQALAPRQDFPHVVTMQLDHQGPVVTYSEAASRPPRESWNSIF